MLNFLKQLFGFPVVHFTGLLPDTRLPSEKDKDYKHEERAVTTPVDPFGNQQILQSPYDYENQNQTSSCVAHGSGLGLAIERKLDGGAYSRLSWIFNYRLRSNYPSEGAYLQGQCDSYRKFGAPLFTTLPTPYTETEANNLQLTQQEYTEAAIYKGLEYWTIDNCKEITTLASVAQQGHGVAILIYATLNEWAVDYPTIQNPNLNANYAEVRHCICILPNSGFMKDGKKYVTIQDSAWFGGKKLRHLSEDFIKARVFGAMYWDKVVIPEVTPAPKYVFTKTLVYGSQGDEVKKMQEFLISQGFLPSGLNTGAFYGRTLAAVNAFQNRYASEILIPASLTRPTGVWGENCRKVANRLCK